MSLWTDEVTAPVLDEIPAAVRVSIGERTRNGMKATDHIRIVEPLMGKEADGWYDAHPAETWAHEHWGEGEDGKLLRVPVRLRSDRISDVWKVYLAAFTGSMRFCSCDNLQGDDPYDPTSWHGDARRAKYETKQITKNGKQVSVAYRTGTTCTACEPATCPWFGDKQDADSKKARGGIGARCEMQGVLTFSLGAEWGPYKGLVGEFRTGGRWSIGALTTCLRQWKQLVDGHLTGYTLWLTYVPKNTFAPGGYGRHDMPALQLLVLDQDEAIQQARAFHGAGVTLSPAPLAHEVAEAEDATGQPAREFYGPSSESAIPARREEAELEEEAEQPAEPEPEPAREPASAAATPEQLEALQKLDEILGGLGVDLWGLLYKAHPELEGQSLAMEQAASIIKWAQSQKTKLEARQTQGVA